MSIDPRTPVLVGIAQRVDRDSAPGEGLSPQDAMAAVAKAAIADSKGRDVAAAIDAIVVTRLFQDSGFPAPFGHQNNLPWSVGKRIGASARRHLYGPVGGNTPQMLVNVFAEHIQNGDHDVVLLAGCEPIRSQAHAAKAGLKLDWAETAPEDAEAWPEKTTYASRHERAHGIGLPVNIYPLFENALCAHYGRDPIAHRQAIGELMARFSAVAANNPYAQLPVARTAAEIITPTAENRYIGYPYTKYLNANMFVDQAAALLLMSSGAADRLQVPQDRRVYLHGSADVHEKILISERVNYWSSPAIKVGAAHALKQAGVSVAELNHIDLYSCFSSAVEIAADAIGLAQDDPRGLTLTGGLPYFGGPGNNYSMHGIAEVAAHCRANPGKPGLVFANGGYITKHSLGVWSTTPRAFSRTDPASYQAEVDSMPSPKFTETPQGRGRIETFNVVHDKGKPAFAIIVGRQEADDSRFLAVLTDNPAALIDVPMVGHAIDVQQGDKQNIATLA